MQLIITIFASILSALLYLIGMSGLYMLFRSTRFAYRPRNAYILLIVGFLTTVLVIYYTGQLLAQKGQGWETVGGGRAN